MFSFSKTGFADGAMVNFHPRVLTLGRVFVLLGNPLGGSDRWRFSPLFSMTFEAQSAKIRSAADAVGQSLESRIFKEATELVYRSPRT